MTYHIGQTIPLYRPRDIVADEMPSAWYALRVQSQRESAVRAMLQSRDIHCCYPERDVTWRIKGRQQARKFPVIAGVVYAKFTRRPQWDVLRARRLIVGVFSSNGDPISIPGDIVRAVMGLPTEAERLEQARQELLRVRTGDRATITGGPLDGFLVDVHRVREGRVWFETLTGIKGQAPVDTVRKVAPATTTS